MNVPKEFGVRLKELLAQNALSASELSRAMGFASRNSLFRILNNETSYEKKKEFLDQLKATDLLNLKSGEWAELEEGLEVARIGPDAYLSNQAMTNLVMPDHAEKEEASFVVESVGKDGRSWVLSDVLGYLFRGRQTHLTIIGCCDVSLFQMIERRLRDMDSGVQVQITHYFDAPGLEMVRAIAAIQPMLHTSYYQGYILKHDSASSEIHDLYHSNIILTENTDADGITHFYQMVLTEPGRLSMVEYSDEAPFRFFDGLYRQHFDRMSSVRSLFTSPVEPAGYLEYTDEYRKLEKNSNLYDIKMDVPINYIHPDILLGSVRDGFAQNGFGQEDERNQLIEGLCEIQLKRWRNFDEKHRVTHTIFTYEAMRTFAMTGRQSDHFFAMRPYTPLERKAILLNLRKWLTNNPYFTYYFFKPGVHPVQHEIGMYEGKGVLLTKGNTGYKLDGDHTEALITQDEFCKRFKDYFLRRLLVHEVTSPAETLRLTDELIALCDR